MLMTNEFWRHFNNGDRIECFDKENRILSTEIWYQNQRLVVTNVNNPTYMSHASSISPLSATMSPIIHSNVIFQLFLRST